MSLRLLPYLAYASVLFIDLYLEYEAPIYSNISFLLGGLGLFQFYSFPSPRYKCKILF